MRLVEKLMRYNEGWLCVSYNPETRQGKYDVRIRPDSGGIMGVFTGMFDSHHEVIFAARRSYNCVMATKARARRS